MDRPFLSRARVLVNHQPPAVIPPAFAVCSAAMTQHEDKQPGLPEVDFNEYGGRREGVRQSLNRRTYFQLLVFDAPAGWLPDALVARLRDTGVASVVYADANGPRGFGLLTWSDDPAHFVKSVRPRFDEAPLAAVTLRPGYTMLGRSYGTGHDPDLEDSLMRRPVRNVSNADYPWHVWYPLRRKGAFSKLEPIDQSHILREHAALGMAYGQAEAAHDVRLACHGIDAEDNEFVIGLVGRELHPLSHLVQAMRKTRQTSEFIEKMGPFFVGYALHRT
jgi:chlorite dismutase